MLDGLVDKAQDAAARTGRKAAIGLGAALCLAVGLAFWTFAGWLFLVSVTTPLNAALIVGGVYSGAGLVMIGTLSSGEKQSNPEPQARSEGPGTADENMGPKIVEAFMNGLQAGRRVRS